MYVVRVVQDRENGLVLLWVFAFSVEVAFAVVEGSRDWKPVETAGATGLATFTCPLEGCDKAGL
jgi:hypothetical protein